MSRPFAEPATRIEEITTPDGLRAVRHEWSEIWERCLTASPFQTPEWLLPWWNHFQPGELWCLALRQGERLVGLVPLFVPRKEMSGRSGVQLVGVGASDYLDVLVEPMVARPALDAVWTHLASRSERWMLGEFPDLPAASPLLARQTPPGLDVSWRAGEVCPVLGLPDKVADLASVVPRRQWQKLQYYRRRAAREAEVSVERADAASLDSMLDELFRLHRARWRLRNSPGVLADEAVQRFHRDVTHGFLPRGMLRLYVLRLGGRVVASLYGFACRGRTYYYLGGFDPDVRGLSPGMLLIGHAIEEAVREGAHEFDFLRGREAYKYDWGAQDRPTFCIQFAPRDDGGTNRSRAWR